MQKNYLQMLKENTSNYSDGYEPVKGDVMKCTICGRKTYLLNDGKGPLICCGKPMIKIGEASSEVSYNKRD
jgi:desulfoferrodoxin-like iron-binding protein